jgi:hypothetical protein
MGKSRTTRTATRARKLTPAQHANLAPVRRAAFSAGVSRSAVVAAVATACGSRPSLSLYNATKLELQVGFMAAALRRKGDNREDAILFAHCLDRLQNYQGHGGSGKLRDGMKGRRSKDEEDAYGSARVLSSAIFKEANVRNPEARGGDTSKTRNARTVKGTATPVKPGRPATPKVKTPQAANDHIMQQAAASCRRS